MSLLYSRPTAFKICNIYIKGLSSVSVFITYNIWRSAQPLSGEADRSKAKQCPAVDGGSSNKNVSQSLTKTQTNSMTEAGRGKQPLCSAR